jgi:hypothetical protein
MPCHPQEQKKTSRQALQGSSDWALSYQGLEAPKEEFQGSGTPGEKCRSGATQKSDVWVQEPRQGDRSLGTRRAGSCHSRPRDGKDLDTSH